MAWHAGAPFAAHLGITTASGERFIRDAQVLRHRLPTIWRRVQSGAVERWRGQRIAQAVLGQHHDVSDAVDQEVAPLAQKIGPISLDRKIQAIKLRLHAEEVEVESLQALDARFVALDEGTINHVGIAEMIVRADWVDLDVFNRTVSRVGLTTLVREWCGNDGTSLTVTPVVDLADHQSSEAYEPPASLRERTGHLAGGHCTFPWCTRPARRCDQDHAVPAGQGGATCSCNLHPLCRRHHRLKTHAGWRVHPIEPGVWHWRDPYGHEYRRDRDGTTSLDQVAQQRDHHGCHSTSFAPWEEPPTNVLREPDEPGAETG